MSAEPLRLPRLRRGARAVLPSAAIEDIVAMRLRQIVSFGHSPEQDDQLPLITLPNQARSYVCDAQDIMMRKERRFLTQARAKLVRAGAMIIAAIDRIDREIARQDGAPAAAGLRHPVAQPDFEALGLGNPEERN